MLGNSSFFNKVSNTYKVRCDYVRLDSVRFDSMRGILGRFGYIYLSRLISGYFDWTAVEVLRLPVSMENEHAVPFFQLTV